MALPTYDTALGFKSGGTAALTQAYTCSGSNRLLLVWALNRNAATGTVTGATYNGVALTQVGTTQSDGLNDASLWRLIAPASGANNIVVNLSASRPVACAAMSFSDVDQTTPLGTAVQNGNLSGGANCTSDQMLASFIGIEDSSTPTAPLYTSTGTGQTERVDDGGQKLYVSCATQSGPATPVTATYTFSATREGTELTVVPVNGITAGGGTTNKGRAALLGVGANADIPMALLAGGSLLSALIERRRKLALMRSLGIEP